MVSRFVTCSLLTAAALVLAACSATGSASPSPAVSTAPESELPAEAGQGTTAAVPASRSVRIVTLGDSYTYGTGTDAQKSDSWPAQLQEALRQRAGIRVYLRNLAEEHSASVQVLEDQVNQVEAQEPDVVTLQVGVVDVVGNETEWYQDNVAAIFDELLLILPPERIFAITTPDHMLTEWGRAGGSREGVEGINASLIEEATARGIEVIDIGPINERVAVDPALVVQGDPPEPYPTAKQYAGWAEAIGPHLYDVLMISQP